MCVSVRATVVPNGPMVCIKHLLAPAYDSFGPSLKFYPICPYPALRHFHPSRHSQAISKHTKQRIVMKRMMSSDLAFLKMHSQVCTFRKMMFEFPFQLILL